LNYTCPDTGQCIDPDAWEWLRGSYARPESKYSKVDSRYAVVEDVIKLAFVADRINGGVLSRGVVVEEWCRIVGANWGTWPASPRYADRSAFTSFRDAICRGDGPCLNCGKSALHSKSLRCTDCLEPKSKLAGNHEGDGGAGGEGGPAQAQAGEHCKTLPAPRCGRTATHAMGGMKGAPGLAGRDPPRDEEAARKCPDCGDEFGPGGYCEGFNYLCPDCGDEIGPSGYCEDCFYRDYLEACKT